MSREGVAGSGKPFSLLILLVGSYNDQIVSVPGISYLVSLTNFRMSCCHISYLQNLISRVD